MRVQKLKAWSAFTLVELLILLSIVGLLLALALPAILHAQEASRRSKCVERIKDIALAMLNFENKRKALPPISTNFDPTPDIPGDASVAPARTSAGFCFNFSGGLQLDGSHPSGNQRSGIVSVHCSELRQVHPSGFRTASDEQLSKPSRAACRNHTVTAVSLPRIHGWPCGGYCAASRRGCGWRY